MQSSYKPTTIYIHREDSVATHVWVDTQQEALEFFDPKVAVETPVMGIDRSITFSHFFNRRRSETKGVVFYVMGDLSKDQPEDDLVTFKQQLPSGFRVVVVTAEIKDDDSQETNCEVVRNPFKHKSLQKNLVVIKFSLPENPPVMSDKKRLEAKKGLVLGLVYLSSVKQCLTSSRVRRLSGRLGLFKSEQSAAARKQDEMQGPGKRFSMAADGNVFADDDYDSDYVPEEAIKEGSESVVQEEVEQTGRDTVTGGWENWNSFSGNGDGSSAFKQMSSFEALRFANNIKAGAQEEFDVSDSDEEGMLTLTSALKQAVFGGGAAKAFGETPKSTTNRVTPK